MEEDEELSRWQQLFPSNDYVHRHEHHDQRKEDVSKNLEEALGVQNCQESNIKDWIESIQCAENLNARSNLMEHSYFDTGCILEDIDAILELDDVDDEALGVPLDFSHNSISNLGSKKNSNKEVQPKALSHYNSKIKEMNFKVWHIFCREKRERQQSLIEWFQASTIQKRQRMCIQAWHRQGKLTRSLLQNYTERKQSRQTKIVFCSWFTSVGRERSWAKKIRHDALQKSSMIAWRQHLSFINSNHRATLHHGRSILVKSIFSFRLELEEKRACLHQDGGGAAVGRKHTNNKIKRINGPKSRNPERDESLSTSVQHTKRTFEKKNYTKASNRCKNGVAKKKHEAVEEACNKVLIHKNLCNKYRHDQDEVEGLSYLQKKRQEKTTQLSKQKELERRKEAWQLAKMHFSICLLRRSFSNSWDAILKEQKLKIMKGDSFRRYNVLKHSFKLLKNNIIQKRNLTFTRAANHFNNRLCVNVLKHWSTVSAHSHHILYHRAECIVMLHRKKRVTELWLSHLSQQRMKLKSWTTIVNTKMREMSLKRTLQSWRAGVQMLQLEQQEEEKIKTTWIEVRGWLNEI